MIQSHCIIIAGIVYFAASGHMFLILLHTYMCVCVCVFSRVRLFVTPWTVAHQAPLSMKFLKQEYWSGLSFPSPGESPRPRDHTQVSCVSCTGRQTLYTVPPGNPTYIYTHTYIYTCASNSKESACNAGDPGLIPGLGRSPGEGNGYPLQYSCLENSMDRRATVHGVAKNPTQLSH